MNRSQALKLLSLGTATTLFSPPFTLNARSMRSRPTQRMKPAVSRWCFNRWSLEKLCEVCQEIGIEGIDLTDASEWPILKKYGIKPVTGMDSSFMSLTHGFNDPAYAAQHTDAYLAFIEASAEAGVPMVIVFTGNREGKDDVKSLDVMAKGIEPLAKKAEKVGITLVTETLNSKVNHPDYQGDSTQYCIDLCEKVGSPNMKVLYDIYHMQIMEGDIIRTIQEKHAYFAHYHTAGVPGRHEINDTQELNYSAIAKAIADTGYTGFFAQEYIPTAETDEAIIADLKDAVERCKA